MFSLSLLCCNKFFRDVTLLYFSLVLERLTNTRWLFQIWFGEQIHTVIKMFPTCGIEEIKEEGPLVSLLNPDHLLGDVFWSWTNTANSQENVVLQEITSQDLHIKAHGEYVYIQH